MQQIWIKKMALISTIIFENLRTSPTNRTVFQMHMPERFVTASSENCHANSSQYVADPSYFGQLGRRGHEFFNEHHQNFGSSHINHSDAAHDVAYYPQKYQPTQTYPPSEQANYMPEQHQRGGHVWTGQNQNYANDSLPHMNIHGLKQGVDDKADT